MELGHLGCERGCQRRRRRSGVASGKMQKFSDKEMSRRYGAAAAVAEAGRTKRENGVVEGVERGVLTYNLLAKSS